MKYLFFVQSEGRGHLTQALTVAKEIRGLGHELVGVIMNQNPIRKIPDFFIDEIGAPIHYIKSPYFLMNKEGNGIDFSKSVIFNLFRLKAYIQSLKVINKLYKKYHKLYNITFIFIYINKSYIILSQYNRVGGK